MPVSAAQSLSYDGRLTFAVNAWMRNTLADVFLGHNPVWVRLKAKGRVETGNLGPQLVEPLMLPQAGGPEAAGVSDPYAPLVHLPMQGMTSAFYTPAEYAIPISVSKRDMTLLTGAKVKKVNYVENVMKKGLKQFFAALNGDLWAGEGITGSAGDATHLASLRTLLNRGGTSTTGTKAPTPLTEQLYNSNTQPGGAAVGSSPITLVGGIERNAAESGYWCTPVKNPSSAETLTQLVYNQCISLATRNDDTPDLGFIYRDGFDKLVTLLQGAGYANLFDLDDTMKKFSGVRYRGVDLMFDDSVPHNGTTSYELMLLNTDYLTLHCESMEPQMERKSDPNRLILPWLGSWYGQLTSGHLGRVHMRHAKLVN